MSYDYYDESQPEVTQSDASYSYSSDSEESYPRMLSSQPSDVSEVLDDSEYGVQYTQDYQSGSDNSEYNA